MSLSGNKGLITPMPHSNHSPGPASADGPSLVPVEGWHVLHLYYRLKRETLQRFSPEQRAVGRQEWVQALQAREEGTSLRLQSFVVMGHKADFGLLLMGPDPLVLDRLQQRLHAGTLGPALEPTFSFVSLTEVSEYVPTVEQYGQRLQEEGEDPQGEAYRVKLSTYESRQEKMRAARLYPEFPPWPTLCFYPMSKKREAGDNWYTLSFEERMRLMTGHGRTGQTFAGKVVQLITASTGLDDWEWGITLWARNPAYLKECVYTMRFDEASARYAIFGPFYVGYILPPDRLFEHLGV